MSPLQRSLKLMRDRGYLCDIVERWIAAARVRKDLYGIADALCIKGEDVVAVQATSLSNVSARVAKIANHENTPIVRKAGIRIFVHGWGRRANERNYSLREVDCS